MSFEAAEKYVRDLEALKHYPEVKREVERLAGENGRLKSRLSGFEKEIENLKAKLSHEVKRREDAEERLEAKTSEAGELRAELGRVSGELEALKEVKLRSTKGRKLTLEQARAEFVGACNDEIEERANDRYLKLKSDYESRMPELVHEKLIATLEGPRWPEEVANAVEAKAREVAGWVLQDREKWPDWFKQQYANEVREGVKGGIDSEFERRAEGEATARTERKLKQLMEVEWPRWREANVEPKVSDLEAKIEENAIRALRGPWRDIKCDRCGTELGRVELTEQGVGDLLSKRYIELECTNSSCEDFPRERHRIRVSLHNLIAAYLEG